VCADECIERAHYDYPSGKEIIMSSISSLSSTTSSMSMMHSMRRPDPAKMAEDLFSKLDTSGQGYLQLSDLQAAYDSISTSSSSSTSSSTDSSSVSDLFSQLDSNSDGKVTKDEFSSSMSKLAQQLDDQFQSSRMQQGMEGMMGGMPPPPANDTGFTKDELTSQLSEIGSSDSSRSTLISSIVENFDKADSNGDGKVNASEAMAYAQSAGIDTQGATGTGSISGHMGMGGMPPPPPPANNTGFTKDELTSQLSKIGSTDSTRASLLSSIVQNFDAADTDGDGKVSFTEAMAYQNSNSTTSSSTASTASSTTSTSATSSTDSQVMLQIMRLMQAYGHGGDSSLTGSQLSVSA
jgi:Ca2+-binding EF-hand superfamily protein